MAIRTTAQDDALAIRTTAVLTMAILTMAIRTTAVLTTAVLTMAILTMAQDDALAAIGLAVGDTCLAWGLNAGTRRQFKVYNIYE